jgi:hypothetical protein
MTGACWAVEPLLSVTALGTFTVGTSIVGTCTVPAVTGTVGTLMVGVPVVDDCWVVVVGITWVLEVVLVLVVALLSGLLTTGTVGIEAPHGAFDGQLSAAATVAKPRTDETTRAAAMMIRLIMGVFSCMWDRLYAGAVAGVEVSTGLTVGARRPGAKDTLAVIYCRTSDGSGVVVGLRRSGQTGQRRGNGSGRSNSVALTASPAPTLL